MQQKGIGKWIIVFSIVFIVFLFNATISFADSPEVNSEHKVGDIIGSFKKSDTEVYINVSCNQYNLSTGYKYIPTYTVNNELCIIVEDLVYYGYTSIWNPKNRTTRLFIDGKHINTQGTKRFIKTQGDIYYTDIKIYVDGHEIPAYNINGYSLVKLSDLVNITDNVYFKKVFKHNENFSIRGTIELPDGEKAPEKGIKVTPVFYFFNNGSLDKYLGEQYVIPEGESSIYYKIELPIHQYWNKMGLENPRIFNFVGYEIENSNDNYITYDMKHTTDTNPLYLQKLNYYEDRYDDITIKILPKQKVKVQLELKGDVFEVFKDKRTREIHVTAIDTENNKFITKEKRISCDQNIVDLEFNLVKNKKYKFCYKIMVFGSFPSGMPLPPSPQFPTFFYNNGIGEIDINLAEEVEVNEENSNLVIKITLPNIVIGDVYESKKKAIYNKQELDVYVVNGNYLVKAKDIESSGHTAYSSANFNSYKRLKNTYYLENEQKSLGKLLVSNWLVYGEKEIRIPIYWLYDENSNRLEELVLVDDLKEFGLQVKYRDNAIEIVSPEKSEM